MSFDYKFVIPPIGQVDNQVLREMFDDVRDYVNTLISGGGTGAPSDAQYVVLSASGDLSVERVLTGTANQVIITDNGANSTVVLSLPQSIATSSNVQFGRVLSGPGAAATPSIYWANSGSPLGFDNENAGSLRITSSASEIANFTIFGSRFTGFVSADTLILKNSGGSGVITFASPGDGTGYTLTFPTDDGTSNQVLTTDGSGNLSWTTPTTGANTALSNLASVAINTTLVSDTNDTDDLGTTSIKWKNLFLKRSINSDAVNLTIGSTPNNASTAFSTNYFIEQFGERGVLGAAKSGVGSSEIFLTNNYYFDGTNDKRLNTDIPIWYVQDSSANHRFYVGTAGTAGSTFTADLVAQLSSSGSKLRGTTTNDDAAAGDIGEYIESTVSNTSTGSTGQYYDITSISLTKGDWDISGMSQFSRNGATFTLVDLVLAITTTSGNNSTGVIPGVNTSEFNPGATMLSFGFVSVSVPVYRMSLSSTTTVYLKGFVDAYSAGTPKQYARISARRVR